MPPNIFSSGKRRVVYQHDHRLALEVDTLVIVPFEFGRRCRSRDEELGVVQGGRIGHPLRPGDEVVLNFSMSASAPFLNVRVIDGSGVIPHQGHVLGVGAVGISRFQAQFLELVDPVRDCQLLAFRARRPSFASRLTLGP